MLTTPLFTREECFLYLMLRSFLFSRSSKRLPPGTTGWPLVGDMLKFATLGPEKYVNEGMNKFSPEVFRTSLMGEKMAVVCGPAGNKFIFSNENKLFASWLPLSLKRVLVFPSHSENSKEEISALKRNFMHEILKPDALRHYIPIMDSMARKHLDEEWEPHEQVKVFPFIEDPERINRIFDHFSRITSGMFSVPIALPGTAYSRAIRGGKMIREALLEVVRQRGKELSVKKDSGASKDLLSRLLRAVDDRNDKLMNEKEIVNNIIGLLIASYDTTSSAVSMVLNYLAQLPQVYNEVLREQMEIAKHKAPGELLTWEDIVKMKYSWNVAREALRLAPPAQGSFREAITDVSYAGFTIPKGWKIFWTVHSTHKNSQYFSDPERFDPSRFEGSGPAPFTYIPFGGGPRMCPGKEYARLEILVLMHNVVTRFKLEKAIPNEEIVFQASPTPSHGLLVRLHPHEKSN
ncbi:hypothetical protein NMG60_11017500 [Bertholletia excelsa]